MTAEERARDTASRIYGTTPDQWWQSIAEAIRNAENEAEQRAIDRCRKIISTAIVGSGDAEAMRRLLLAAFDPAWDRVASIINPIPPSAE